MNFEKLYILAVLNLHVCTALERCNCDSRKLSPKMKNMYDEAKKLQAGLTPEEQDEAVKMIGRMNALRLQIKRNWWEYNERHGFKPCD